MKIWAEKKSVTTAKYFHTLGIICFCKSLIVSTLMPTPLTDSTAHIHLHSPSLSLDRQDERLDSSLPGIPSNIAGADPVALWNRLLSPQGVVQMMAINTLNVSQHCPSYGKQNTNNDV